MRHCDEIADDTTQPECVRRVLHYFRLPASCKCADMDPGHVALVKSMMPPDIHEHIWTAPEPTLFADHGKTRVRVVMASRLGDVGITKNLTVRRGYEKRVMVEELTNFSESM